MKYLLGLFITISFFSSCKKEDVSPKTVVSTLELVITGTVPTTVSKIRLTNTSDNTFAEKAVTASATDGTNGLRVQLPLYTTDDVDAKISAYYTDGTTVSKIISSVKVESGKKTVISGPLSSSFKITVNGELDGEIRIDF
ncbi:hypothetical protein [Pararcticibacter amylolyticus]|uniref:Uncharacterized protein n=1 Tax=Pararcticibacter amylolyticus TaxID=2173175 RepID=A0A2U2P9N6_9SPHI|nr:hypothetical protein [Pararcticibacter amylolyticus]PWG78102.1 hypothetical protein DDR33_24100 [Pararcticibacter amylolyticus]